MATYECYIAIIEMDNHLQALNIKERKVTVEPTKDLEEIFLDDDTIFLLPKEQSRCLHLELRGHVRDQS